MTAQVCRLFLERWCQLSVSIHAIVGYSVSNILQVAVQRSQITSQFRRLRAWVAGIRLVVDTVLTSCELGNLIAVAFDDVILIRSVGATTDSPLMSPRFIKAAIGLKCGGGLFPLDAHHLGIWSVDDLRQRCL